MDNKTRRDIDEQKAREAWTPRKEMIIQRLWAIMERYEIDELDEIEDMVREVREMDAENERFSRGQ